MYTAENDDEHFGPPPPPYQSVEFGEGGDPQNYTQPQQNAQEYYSYGYDEQNNWGQWAATIDEKIDALMDRMNTMGGGQTTEGQLLMAHVDKRINDTILDYKREIHQQLTHAVANVEDMHMQAISKMQVVSEKYIHELHERQVHTVLLNQNLDSMGEVDEIQQKLHEKFCMERQGMLNDVDARLQMHAQKWELGHTPIMANMQKRLADLENVVQDVIQEVKNWQHVHNGHRSQAEHRHSMYLGNMRTMEENVLRVRAEFVSQFAHLQHEVAKVAQMMSQNVTLNPVPAPPEKHENVLLKKELQTLKHQMDMVKMAQKFHVGLHEPKAPSPGERTPGVPPLVQVHVSKTPKPSDDGLVQLLPIGGGGGYEG
jgi:hypothetical protein